VKETKAQKQDALVKLVGEILAPAATTLAMGGTRDEAAAASLHSAIGKLFQAAFDRRDQLEAANWAAFIDALLAGQKDPRVVSELLAHAAENPVVQDLLAEAARLISDCLAPSVVPPIGKLVGEYSRESRKADGFFRGMRRLLTDLTEEEFRELRTILGAATADIPEQAPWIELEIVHGPNPADDIASLMRSPVWPASGQMHQGSATCVLRPAPASASRLFQLLELNRLAVPGTQRWGLTLPASLLMQIDTLQRIKTIVE
jgi:hypothetical protein